MLAAEVLIRLQGKPHGPELSSYQSSKIASIGLHIPFPANPRGKGIDPALLDTFDERLHGDIALCFAHTCITTGSEDFVYLLTFAESEEQPDQRIVVIDFELHCHVTEFVMMAEERLLYACG